MAVTPAGATGRPKSEPVRACSARSPRAWPSLTPKFMAFICSIMPTIGPIISRASAGMVSRCARFICSATGLTRRFHIGMVSASQSSAFHVRGWAFADGSVVASSSQRSARRTDSSTAVRSPAETAALSPTCWRAMRSAISKFTDSPSVRAFIVEPMPESICPNWFKISPKPP